MDQIRPEIRTFALGTIGLATATWNVTFNLGAYRTVFYSNIFAVMRCQKTEEVYYDDKLAPKC